MTRRWITLGLMIALALTVCSPAQAQRGRRHSRTMTPFGAMPSGMSLPQYNAMLQQRQMMQMQQQQMKMQQQWLKQMAAQQKKQEQARKNGKTTTSGKDKDSDKGKEAVEASMRTPLTRKERLDKERERLNDARARLGLSGEEKPSEPFK